jgi:hypothetical protein
MGEYLFSSHRALSLKPITKRNCSKYELLVHTTSVVIHACNPSYLESRDRRIQI